MEISNAQYVNHSDGTQINVHVTIDGKVMFVPLDPANRHYAAIMKLVNAGTLTIAEADNGE